MNDTKRNTPHTPGPWSLSLNIHDEDHGEQEYLHIIAKKRMSDIGMIRVAKHKPIRTTDEANARLIAAAPEMYEKLCEICNVIIALEEKGVNIPYHYFKDDMSMSDKLREVLAKVDGGEG